MVNTIPVTIRDWIGITKLIFVCAIIVGLVVTDPQRNPSKLLVLGKHVSKLYNGRGLNRFIVFRIHVQFSGAVFSQREITEVGRWVIGTGRNKQGFLIGRTRRGYCKFTFKQHVLRVNHSILFAIISHVEIESLVRNHFLLFERSEIADIIGTLFLVDLYQEIDGVELGWLPFKTMSPGIFVIFYGIFWILHPHA